MTVASRPISCAFVREFGAALHERFAALVEHADAERAELRVAVYHLSQRQRRAYRRDGAYAGRASRSWG